MGLVTILSHSLGCHFVLLTVSIALQNLLGFRRSHLLIVDHSVCASGVTFRKQSPVPINLRVFPTSSSNRFSVALLMWRFLIHLDFRFVYGDRHGSICSFLHVRIQLCQHYLLKMLSLFRCSTLATFKKNEGFIGMYSLSGFSVRFHCSTCLFFPIPTCFQEYSSVIELKIRNTDAPGISFIIKVHLAVLCLLFLHIMLSMFL